MAQIHKVDQRPHNTNKRRRTHRTLKLGDERTTATGRLVVLVAVKAHRNKKGVIVYRYYWRDKAAEVLSKVGIQIRSSGCVRRIVYLDNNKSNVNLENLYYSPRDSCAAQKDFCICGNLKRTTSRFCKSCWSRNEKEKNKAGRVVLICPDCQTRREITKVDYRRRKTDYCFKCYSKRFGFNQDQKEKNHEELANTAGVCSSN